MQKIGDFRSIFPFQVQNMEKKFWVGEFDQFFLGSVGLRVTEVYFFWPNCRQYSRPSVTRHRTGPRKNVELAGCRVSEGNFLSVIFFF